VSSTPASALARVRSPSSNAVIAALGNSTNRTCFELAGDDVCPSLSSVTVLIVAARSNGVQRFPRLLIALARYSAGADPAGRHVPMKISKIVALLERDGWRLRRVSGSCRHFTHPSKPGLVTVIGRPSAT
jgi:predicted RNA binding protein YcfA (HicA-like mRNA interferase family)